MTDKLKLVVFFQTGVQYGAGHKYRCLELIRAAKERGFEVEGLSNDDSTRLKFKYSDKAPATNFNPGSWKMWMNKIKANWIIFDLPHQPKDYQINYCKDNGVRMANINASGFAEGAGLDADISWSELNWEQNSPDKFIIRRDIRHILREPESNSWFCFGGSADPMSLLEKFSEAIPRDRVWLCGTPLRQSFVPKSQNQTYINCDGGTGIWQYMRYAAKACNAMGMICVESAAMGLPQWIFSRSPEHLHYAKQLESYGLCNAYPEVGIPNTHDMLAFFRKPCVLNIDNRPDCRGADRFLDVLLEKNKHG